MTSEEKASDEVLRASENFRKSMVVNVRITKHSGFSTPPTVVVPQPQSKLSKPDLRLVKS